MHPAESPVPTAGATRSRWPAVFLVLMVVTFGLATWLAVRPFEIDGRRCDGAMQSVNDVVTSTSYVDVTVDGPVTEAIVHTTRTPTACARAARGRLVWPIVVVALPPLVIVLIARLAVGRTPPRTAG